MLSIIWIWNNKILIHCCILLVFLYELYYDARIHKHQVNNFQFTLFLIWSMHRFSVKWFICQIWTKFRLWAYTLLLTIEDVWKYNSVHFRGTFKVTTVKSLSKISQFKSCSLFKIFIKLGSNLLSHWEMWNWHFTICNI